ncbi:MAG: flagellar hook assembly protein FlgD [Gammaproteobacteria bacterium]|nr:flagellar hook assembly protein FlgD [Gammaproteobacteria bacterium]
MTTTNAIDTATTGAAATARKSATSLDINDFLTLMSTQLNNQDPLKPLDSTAFVAQLAQFGTVSGIQSMQASLATLTQSLRASQALSGATLVGHAILAPGEQVSYSGATGLYGAVQVPAGASSVAVNVYDASGQLVRHLNVPAAAGQQPFAWDGNADNGAALPAGRYRFEALANVGGTGQSLQPQLYATVGSVSIGSDGTSLTLNTSELGPVALGRVTQIL